MRYTSRILGLLLLATAATACGSDPQQEQKKALLRPDETRRRLAEELERQRMFDAKGELIGSGEDLAELEMPKGLKLYRRLERAYYLEAPRISMEQLERYFGPRLEPTGVARTATSVTYENARIKDRPAAPPISLRISSVEGTEPACDVQLRVTAPAGVALTAEETEKILEEKRKYAN